MELLVPRLDIVIELFALPWLHESLKVHRDRLLHLDRHILLNVIFDEQVVVLIE